MCTRIHKQPYVIPFQILGGEAQSDSSGSMCYIYTYLLLIILLLLLHIEFDLNPKMAYLFLSKLIPSSRRDHLHEQILLSCATLVLIGFYYLVWFLIIFQAGTSTNFLHHKGDLTLNVKKQLWFSTDLLLFLAWLILNLNN